MPSGGQRIEGREEILDRPAGGGGDAFDFAMPARLADAYRDNHAAVATVARRVCGTEHASDVTQAVFFALWREPQKFDPNRGSLRSYLLVLAHHRAVDVVRSETARLAREQRVDATCSPPPAKADEHLLGDDIAIRVRSALGGLPVNEREAIVSAFYEHRSYRETAQWLGAPEGTIKSRVRSGLKRLRPMLTDLCVDEGDSLF